ncbi:hypothetical protein CGGC5_v001238 [Colletotrichum fructicola Nara gc5]|uniref:Uncharacterized protein n=1 Tax=Colletotrichum fructicola (strain Nara gc5) TaxID=1213859 RepID=A0A7J6IKG1_COLFN|nr:hypothetical protein CGGC5_v014815 [Colletotrichum fructicola Nara gc5]KAF4480980.1 hypothetical protein CGGC5_v011225 [Colletotrichum fructicola Nara gc5]KAF4484591.1 hypothetical protein CGGC5_v008019 [Colletotrichum fructicola Nara gc5]KAF4490129.1 hypothetical protein CGGC5_v003752 [Colletotrichum fructicola Nara gc5]KAF4490757.1 hypothetical protein CGGC5_v001238 [Colletotrichum fructicola Nara gc5]
MFAHYDQCSHRHHIAVDLFPSSADGHYSGAFPPRSELSPLSATEGPQPQLQIWTSDLSKAIWCINPRAPFDRCSTASIIEVGELF